MGKIYRHVLPIVHRELKQWKERAANIPNPELRHQALESIRTKTFHCEGGAIFSLLALENKEEAVRFIVAYQTISDYLDNLCDRSTSLDPNDFRALHDSMMDALTPDSEPSHYYRYRDEQDDGGYLLALVQTCQDVLKRTPYYDAIQHDLHSLAQLYSDLQVHKHVTLEEREPRLKQWFEQHASSLPPMTWYEFSASAGSTLGIFCLVSYAQRPQFNTAFFNQIVKSYFPWVQGLHILLDYFIDQEEDRMEGDLNFCFYYDSEEHLAQRLSHFIREADDSIRGLPDEKFHRMINHGMLGIYLADKKVGKQRGLHRTARKIIQRGGHSTWFFFVNGWVYRRLKWDAN